MNVPQSRRVRRPSRQVDDPAAGRHAKGGRALFIALLVAAAGCGGAEPEPLDLTGTWTGAADDGTAVTLNISHDLSTNRLSGTWVLAFGPASLTGTLDGTLANGSVTIAMHLGGTQLGFTGAVADEGTTLRGTVRDANGGMHPVVLTKA